MKQILLEYLSQLKEREELDAILPDLLSELGFHVYSRPQRGTTQHGVDIAAVGKDPDDGKRKVYLFSVKRGDLTRQEWDQGDQALRPSLNQIRDAYIPTKIPSKYRGLPVVICLVFGGVVKENIQAEVRGYIASNTTPIINYEEWNGDRLAELLLEGVLREKVLPAPLQHSFRKAVALVDEPDVAYAHFADFTRQVRTRYAKPKDAVLAARQLSICCWVMFVWGRSSGNVDAAFRATELALLNVWDLFRPLSDSNSRPAKDLMQAVVELLRLYLRILSEFLSQRVEPHVKSRDAIAAAVGGSALDVNLALFDLLGRIALGGLWMDWFGERSRSGTLDFGAAVDTYIDLGLSLIQNNSALTLPITDEQATDVALFLLLWCRGKTPRAELRGWIQQMIRRYRHSVGLQKWYPTCKSEYRDLLSHPVDRSATYFEEATAASTLIPLLSVWATAARETVAAADLAELVDRKFKHCTMQLWTLDGSSDQHLWVNDQTHGRAIVDIPVKDGAAAIAMLEEIRARFSNFGEISAVRTNFGPMILTACRHWRLPIPIEFYSPTLASAIAPPPATEAGDESEPPKGDPPDGDVCASFESGI